MRVDWESLLKRTLDKMIEDPTFLSERYKHGDTINLLITCELLGFVDPGEWVVTHSPSKYRFSDYFKEARSIKEHLGDWCSYSVPIALSYMDWTRVYLKASGLREAYEQVTN